MERFFSTQPESSDLSEKSGMKKPAPFHEGRLGCGQTFRNYGKFSSILLLNLQL